MVDDNLAVSQLSSLWIIQYEIDGRKIMVRAAACWRLLGACYELKG